jgi:RNA polymerase II-associated factor 1
VRVRHLNPLPPPPFPPKLFDIETDLSRLGDASYLAPLAAATQLPMMVDSEMGMPLDLNAYRDAGVWDGAESGELGSTSRLIMSSATTGSDSFAPS